MSETKKIIVRVQTASTASAVLEVPADFDIDSLSDAARETLYQMTIDIAGENVADDDVVVRIAAPHASVDRVVTADELDS